MSKLAKHGTGIDGPTWLEQVLILLVMPFAYLGMVLFVSTRAMRVAVREGRRKLRLGYRDRVGFYATAREALRTESAITRKSLVEAPVYIRLIVATSAAVLIEIGCFAGIAYCGG